MEFGSPPHRGCQWQITVYMIYREFPILRFVGRNDGGFVISVAKIFITDDESHGRKVCPSEI